MKEAVVSVKAVLVIRYLSALVWWHSENHKLQSINSFHQAFLTPDMPECINLNRLNQSDKCRDDSRLSLLHHVNAYRGYKSRQQNKSVQRWHHLFSAYCCHCHRFALGFTVICIFHISQDKTDLNVPTRVWKKHDKLNQFREVFDLKVMLYV